ncbi:MAG: hypothetical protein ACM3XM_19135 [Mycobacterium leprae]
MNVLPTGLLTSAEERRHYFEAMDRLGFDVAYTAYYGNPLRRFQAEELSHYRAFAADAGARRRIPCAQIQSLVASLDDLPVAEAQHHADNSPRVEAGSRRLHASFASRAWLEHLKQVTRALVQECGFRWVVYEEPFWAVDVPGPGDRFYQVFRERYPDLPYPVTPPAALVKPDSDWLRLNSDRNPGLLNEVRSAHRAAMETESYLAVQQLKQDVMVEFFRELTAYARSVGAEQVGIMPWFFVPTTENSAAATAQASCPTGRLAALKDLDFLVVRMQPDNLYVHCHPLNALTNENGECHPRLAYVETLAHHLGKPVITVSNPTNERNWDDWPGGRVVDGVLPAAFHRQYLLAAMAAAPNGLTRHWYQKRAETGLDTTVHDDFQATVNRHMNRLGDPRLEVAFLFSYRGTCHAAPLANYQVWDQFWAVAEELALRRHMPLGLLCAEALAEGVAVPPAVRVVLVSGLYPPDDAAWAALVHWWEAAPGRTLLVAAGTEAYGVRPDQTGLRPLAEALPWVAAFFAAGDYRTGPHGNKALWLHADATQCREALAGQVCDATPPPPVLEASWDVLWSQTQRGYLVLSNLTPSVGVARLAPGLRLWDVRRRRWHERGGDWLALAPLEFELLRQVPAGSPLLDVEGAVRVDRLAESATAVRVGALVNEALTFCLSRLPEQVVVDGAAVSPDVVRTPWGAVVTVPVDGPRNVAVELSFGLDRDGGRVGHEHYLV